MIEKVNSRDFDAVFRVMEASFPSDEYRNREEQRALFENPVYSVFAWKDENALQAFIAVWEFEKFVFVEHLAVNPPKRNGGIGAKLLREMKAVFGKRLCLEVELPETENARRRIGFYRRNHFFLNEYPYIQPPMSKGKNAVPLLIMTTDGALDEKSFQEIKETLYREVYRYEESAVGRVQRMEAFFDTVCRAMKQKSVSVEENPAIAKMLQELAFYYDSGQWLSDYERDEQGEFPADLRRGVLSQDGLYDLLMEWR